MTEIPEHLLKRSRDRRSALGLGGDEAADAGASASATTPAATPATTTAATPAAASGPAPRKAAAAPAATPPPKPDSPVVAAYTRRAKIPFWAMGALSLLPVWAFMYIRAVTEPPVQLEGPLAEGAEVYTGAGACSGCHGAAGGGGTGYAFADGEVQITFPHIEDQLRYVYFGTAGYQQEGIAVYGNPEREGGAHETGARGVMPAQEDSLTDAEILGVVCHERYALGGADPESDEWVEEYENWCSPESPLFIALEEGVTLAELADEGIENAEGEPIEMIPIGDVPVEGSPPGD